VVKLRCGAHAANRPSSAGPSMRRPVASMRQPPKKPAHPSSSSALPEFKKAFKGKCFRCLALIKPTHPSSPSTLLEFKKVFKGKWLQCLATDHQLVHCREPRWCLNYWGSGHFARECKAPPNHRSKPSIRSRLTFPPGSIHTFPELSYAPPASSSPATAMAAHSDRYIAGRVVMVASSTMSALLQKLCHKDVVLSTQDTSFEPRTVDVTYVLHHHLRIPH
jgi:hypothetical protein